MTAETPEPTNGRAASALIRLHDRFETLVDSRITVTILFIILGVVGVMIAGRMGIGSVRFDGVLVNGFDVLPAGHAGAFEKEVGYFYALNWAAFGCLVAPFVVFAGLGVLQSIRTTLLDLCARGMIRDKDFRPVPLSEVEPLLAAHLRRSRAVFLIVFAVVMIFMLSDWWDVVGGPILHPETVRAPLSDPAMEYDWSVASLYPGQEVNRWGLLIFGLVGYVVLAGFVPAFFVGVLLSAVYFVTFLINIDRGGHGYRLAAIPEREFADPYFGFKSFEFFFNNLLIACMLIMLALWVMLVQNIYLRDPTSPDIAQFLLHDVAFARKILGFKAAAGEASQWALGPALRTLENLQVALSVLLAPVVFLTALFLCWMLLRKTALKARSLSRQHLAQIAAEIGETPETTLPKLREMRIWPVGWISLVQLAAVMLVLAASMLNYRLVFVPITFVVLKLAGMLAVSIWAWLYSTWSRSPTETTSRPESACDRPSCQASDFAPPSQQGGSNDGYDPRQCCGRGPAA